MIAARARLAVLPVVLALSAWPGVASARPPAVSHASSVVSLLAPARGSAFAYGAGGDLLTTRRAVAGAPSVDVVTATGEHETVRVTATAVRGLVLLAGHIALPALGAAGPGAAAVAGPVVAQAGPLDGGRRQRGRFVDGSRVTTMRAAAPYEGAPVLDGHGRVAGVATRHGQRLAALRVSGLGAEAGGGGTSAIVVVLLVLAVLLAVGAASTLVVRRRRRDEQAGAVRSTGAEPPVDVALRPRTHHPPAEGVQLRRRPRRDDGAAEDRYP